MFLKATKVGKGRGTHSHVIYISDVDGKGLTSNDNGHYHEIIMSGNVPTVAVTNGHSHDVSAIPTKNFLPNEDETTVVSNTIELYKIARDYEKESRLMSQESEDFYSNKQWDDAVKQELLGKRRAALTINEIESKIDLLSGYQRQNRTDIKTFPVEDGDSRVSDILTSLIKNVTEQTNFEFEETEVFEDCAITGRGLFNIYIDYDKNISGDIVIEKFNWKDCFFGPHDRKDLSDCDYLIKSKWYSKVSLANMFPEKADQLSAEFDLDIDETDNRGSSSAPGQEYENKLNKVVVDVRADSDLIDIARKEFRLLELWRKVYYKSSTLVNAMEDVYLKVDDWNPEDINKVASIDGFEVINQKKHRMRITQVASNVLLSDEMPDLASQNFHIIPLYGKKKGKKWWGKVESVKDSQREVNKRHSQAVDILNKVAAYGWFIDGASFSKPSEKERFVNQSSSPGFVIEVGDLSKIPQRVDGVKFPSEITGLMAISSDKIREIMNINPEMLGMNSKAESGLAIIEKKKQGLIGNEFLFDNLSLCKRTLGRMLVAIIQKVYTPERMLRILENTAKQGQPVQIGNEPLMPMEVEGAADPAQEAQQLMMAQEARRKELIDLLNNEDLTKYDVVVGESAFSPTNKHANFMVWSQLAMNGIPVPPSVLVDLSDLPDKEKVKQAIQAEMDQQIKMEQAKMETEIRKTQIAKGDNTGMMGTPTE